MTEYRKNAKYAEKNLYFEPYIHHAYVAFHGTRAAKSGALKLYSRAKIIFLADLIKKKMLPKREKKLKNICIKIF